MKRVVSQMIGLAICSLLFAANPVCASSPRVWHVPSLDHGQTFAYGSEQNRSWQMRGADRHLALYMTFTNDPFVDRDNPRQYDYFTFGFPQVKMGSDGHTFYYHAPGGRLIPVAVRKPGFLGIEEIKLLDSSYLVIKKPHGYLSLTLVVQDHQ